MIDGINRRISCIHIRISAMYYRALSSEEPRQVFVDDKIVKLGRERVASLSETSD